MSTALSIAGARAPRTARFRSALLAVGPVPFVVVLTAAGLVLRFSTLGMQSYWFDEGLTVLLSKASFGAMLSGDTTEALPSLYFVLAWAWTHLFGVSEIGLRSLSALAGTLTIPVAYAAAKEMVGERIGLGVAVLTAVSPAFVWYSQEARPYALLTLLSALSLLFFAGARRRPATRNFVGWAVASALALATHYFALIVVVPEALWLLYDARNRRAALIASTALAAVAAGLAPLALYQRVHGGPAWIAGTPFRGRLGAIPYLFVTGRDNGQHSQPIVIVSVLAFGLAVALVLRGPRTRRRSGALVALGVGMSAIAIPVAGKLVGSDYVLARNMLAAWLPFTVFVVAALATRPRWQFVGGLVVASLAALAINVVVAVSPGLQRDDWRGVAAALGPARPGRLIIVAPKWQYVTLADYRPRMRFMPPTATASELDTVTFNGYVPFRAPIRVITPGFPFRRTQTTTIQRFTIVRYVAAQPTAQLRSALTGLTYDGGTPFTELAPGGRPR